MTSPLDELQAQLKRRVAGVDIRVDAPASASGSWWIDVENDGVIASVEWRPNIGFGIAGPNGGYGEGADVVVDDVAKAADEVVRLLERRAAVAR
ncbi:MAG TPA: hypothetical protein VMU84_09690 [Thermoanaerobaculia bacterium]|nr:hypothetical protein [Thermoanaerobaculia bacterium]